MERFVIRILSIFSPKLISAAPYSTCSENQEIWSGFQITRNFFIYFLFKFYYFDHFYLLKSCFQWNRMQSFTPLVLLQDTFIIQRKFFPKMFFKLPVQTWLFIRKQIFSQRRCNNLLLIRIAKLFLNRNKLQNIYMKDPLFTETSRIFTNIKFRNFYDFLLASLSAGLG